MIGRIFWICTGLMLGVAVHLGTILYFPGFSFQRKLNSVMGNHTANSFFILPPETQATLLPSATAQDIVGLCLLDLAKGKVTVAAKVPQSLWTFTVYNTSGQQVYAINDIEAGADSFNMEVAKAKSLLEQVRGKPEPEDLGKITNSGWHTEVPGDKALAILWLPVPEPRQRKELEAVVNGTSCAG